MRVLVVCAPQYGHLLPLLPLCHELIGKGHDVLVATGPAMVDFARSQGVRVVSVGKPVDLDRKVSFGSKLGSWHATAGQSFSAQDPRNFVELAVAMSGDLIAVARRARTDLIVHEPFAVIGPKVAALMGIPAVMHSWGLDLPAELTERMRSMLDERLGGPSVTDAASIIIDPCPPSVQCIVDPRPRVVVRYEPYGGFREPSRRRGKTRILLTVGSVAPKLGGLDVVRRVSAATAGLGIEVVVAVTEADADLVEDLGDHVDVRASVPLGAILSTCVAAVHHGGAGTTLTCLAYGLPQVIVPLLADNEFHARRLSECGVARAVSRTAEVDCFANAVVDVVSNPRYTTSAVRIRNEIERQKPMSDAVDALVDLCAEEDQLRQDA